MRDLTLTTTFYLLLRLGVTHHQLFIYIIIPDQHTAYRRSSQPYQLKNLSLLRPKTLIYHHHKTLSSR